MTVNDARSIARVRHLLRLRDSWYREGESGLAKRCEAEARSIVRRIDNVPPLDAIEPYMVPYEQVARFRVVRHFGTSVTGRHHVTSHTDLKPFSDYRLLCGNMESYVARDYYVPREDRAKIVYYDFESRYPAALFTEAGRAMARMEAASRDVERALQEN